MNQHQETLISFYRNRKRMPAYREMMQLFGFRSKNAVYKLVQKFIDAGIVRKDGDGKLVPGFSFSEVPLLGLVKAGVPASVESVLQDTVSIDDYLIEKKEKTFILEVDGDSMIDAHIEKGDLVIAERSQTAREGDIVIAEVDGEWTMKYYRVTKGKVWLEAANTAYKPIHPQYSLRIAAIVRGVVRKY